MRRITSKEMRKAGNIYCPFCKPAKIKAVWRKDGCTDRSTDVSCEIHKFKIEERDRDDHYTEADYQTWLSL